MKSNLKDCANNWGVVAEGNEWSNNILSPRAVQGPTGQIGYPGTVDHPAPEPAASRARALANTVGGLSANMPVGMGSEGSEGFQPHWVVATEDWSAGTLSIEAVKSAFGGALFPASVITLEPLSVDADWFERVREDCWEDEALLARWHAVLAWFAGQDLFTEAAFVAIDPKDPYAPGGGSCRPRLLLGRLQDGSFAGLFGYVVYT